MNLIMQFSKDQAQKRKDNTNSINSKEKKEFHEIKLHSNGLSVETRTLIERERAYDLDHRERHLW